MKRLGNAPLLVALAAATAILLLLFLQPAGIMESYDLARMHQSYKADLRASFLAGEIPWWNPYTALGRPFLADVETATLYPPSWLVIPLGVTAGIFAIIWLHIALAIDGTRRLAEQFGVSRPFALVAGISFALSGALLGRLQSGQLQVFCVLCLFPWVWLAGIKLQDELTLKSVARMAGWLAVAFLAGSPQFLWCGLILLGGILVLRCTSLRAAGFLGWRLLAAGALAAGLSAVQLLPFIELIQQGNRPLHDTSFALRAGESTWGWLTLIIPPGFYSLPTAEYNLSVGPVFLLLAGLAIVTAFRDRNVRALAVAGLLGGTLALGDNGFILPVLADWLPGFSSLRYPSRYALGSTLICALLAVWWLDQAARKIRLTEHQIVVLLGIHAVTLIAGLFVQSKIYRVPTPPANDAQLISDLREAGLPQDGAPPRVALPPSILIANAGAQSGISALSGFNNPALARTWTALYLMANKPLPIYHRAEVPGEVVIKAGENKSYFSVSALFNPEGKTVAFGAPPMPRSFLSFGSREVGNWREAILKIRGGHDFVREALVEQPLARPGVDRDLPTTGRTEIIAFGRSKIVVDYVASAPALLVLAEAWYPGWTATLNTKGQVAVIPVNGWMRGVEVPAGSHQVILNYRPTHWWLGLIISALSSVSVFWLWRFSGSPLSAGRGS